MRKIVATLKRAIIKAVLWLTRIAGAAFVVAGLGSLVAAVNEGSLGLAAIGLVVIGVGVFVGSVYAPSPDQLEYKLLRRIPKSGVKVPP